MSALRPSPNRSSPPPHPDDAAAHKEIRQKLIQRLAIAACLIALVGVAITVLNRFEEGRTEQDHGSSINPLQAQLTEPKLLEPKQLEPNPIVESKPSTNSVVLSEITSSSPTSGSISQVNAAPKSSVNKPTTPVAVPTSPAPASSALNHSAAAKPVPAPTVAATIQPPNSSPQSNPSPAPPTLSEPKLSDPPRELPKVLSNKPAPPEQTTNSLASRVLPAGSRGFTVQAGVFQSSNNAQRLVEKLGAAGIPARVETRIQVGPFRNKVEAERMMKRLRELGVTPLLQPPTH